LDVSRRSVALALAVAIGSALGSTSATAQTRKFDGQWSVQVLTDKGDCEKVYRYPVVIQNGAVRYGGAEDFAASGSVGANGAIRGSITRDDLRADVTGRLSGKSGGGTWRTTGGCSGNWNAEKRG
jgi:hypothetical protein